MYIKLKEFYTDILETLPWNIIKFEMISKKRLEYINKISWKRQENLEEISEKSLDWFWENLWRNFGKTSG